MWPFFRLSILYEIGVETKTFYEFNELQSKKRELCRPRPPFGIKPTKYARLSPLLSRLTAEMLDQLWNIDWLMLRFFCPLLISVWTGEGVTLNRIGEKINRLSAETCRYKGYQIDITMCPIAIKVNWIKFYFHEKVSRRGKMLQRIFIHLTQVL